MSLDRFPVGWGPGSSELLRVEEEGRGREGSISDLPLVFQNNSSSRGNNSTGQAEDQRLGFSESEPQTKYRGRCQCPSTSLGDFSLRVLVHSYDCSVKIFPNST